MILDMVLDLCNFFDNGIADDYAPTGAYVKTSKLCITKVGWGYKM